MVSSFGRDLRTSLRGEVYLDEISRSIYATDASHYQMMPVAVAVPRDGDDLAAAVAIAAKHGVSILPRAGGTSLAGQTVGHSLVLDVSKSMNRILEVNAAERRVRVEPGRVRDELNVALASHGLYFAPDPATADRACVGGMIGNNSSGTRSIVYGKTVDHVLGMKVLLADGTLLELGPRTPAEWKAREASGGREGEIHRGFRRLIEEHRGEIERRFPRVMRRVGGYNLDEFVPGQDWNLARLITGSEGTLGLVLEATLNLEPVPRHTALCIVHFDDLLESIRAVPAMLEYQPSAVELLDALVLALARENPGSRALCDFLVGHPEAVQIVEVFGETAAGAEARIHEVASGLAARGIGYAHPVRTDAAGQARVIAVRKSGLGFMLGKKGEAKASHFLEDACVPVAVLAEYIEKVLAICRKHGADVTLYAHASVGVIHVQPMLNLKRTEDIAKMKAIADEAFELVVHYGGSWSGEHGDGLVRSPYLERFFGRELYGAFRDVKALFDPAGLMNPGKIVNSPPMDENLRFGPGYEDATGRTEYRYRDFGSFGAAVEMCSGVGACRRTLSGTMCPSYRVTRDEEHSTRGRANALRMAMSGQLGPDAMTGERLFEVLDLCLSCKACKTECPSGVDMARLKSEFLQGYRDRHGVTRRDRFIAGSPEAASRLAGPLAGMANRARETALFRRALEGWAGFDRRRIVPPFATESFQRWFDGSQGRRAGAVSGERDGARTVVLFDDTYLNYHEPHIGRAAVELLESAGYQVMLARAGCCQRPRLSHGFLRDARRLGERTLRNLAALIARGMPVVVVEPGCASALVDDLPDLVEDASLGRVVREGTTMIDLFLDRERKAGKIGGGVLRATGAERVMIHGHCHQKALFGTQAMRSLLDLVPDLEVSEIDGGCCGMAGAFGYEKEHYDLSMKIGGERLFPAVRAAGGNTGVIACGFSCRHQIEHATGIRPVHWVETLRMTAV